MPSFDFILTKRGRCCAALLAAVIVLSGMHRAAAAALPPATALLTQGLQSFKPYGKDMGQIRIDEVAVTGQPFAAALRVDIPGRPAGGAQNGLVAQLTEPLKKGDVLWLSFKARRLDSKRETGEAFVEVRMERLVNGKYTWPSHLDRGISIGAEWSETSIPFVLEQDVAPADTRIVIALDNYQQRFEIGPVTLLNYGPGVPLAALPRSTVRYAGDAPDAAWR